MLELRADCTNRVTVVAVVVVPVPVAGVEVEVVRVVGVVRVLRTRPVVAVGAGVVEFIVPTKPTSRKETQRYRLPSDTDIGKEHHKGEPSGITMIFLGLIPFPRQAAYEFANLYCWRASYELNDFCQITFDFRKKKHTFNRRFAFYLICQHLLGNREQR